MVSWRVGRWVLESRRVAVASWVVMLVIASLSAACLAEAAEPDGDSEDRPVALDLSKKVAVPIRSVGAVASLAGKREFDGQPFQIDGVIQLYGRTAETNRQEVYPESALGIEVGRKFEELHLVHHAMWPDVEGDAVANVCLNYTDGTQHTFPIRYGVHVLDWYDLPSYEGESVTDPYTRICWRHPPRQYNAPVRLFKSTFINPHADKTVQTIDVVSAKNLAAYCLLAATVSESGTIPQPELPAKKGFDAKLTIRIVDDENDKPIEGALVLPGLLIEDVYLVGTPFRTSKAGEGVVPFPTKTTTSLTVRVSKAGYEDEFQSWEVPAPQESTIRLRRSPGE